MKSTPPILLIGMWFWAASAFGQEISPLNAAIGDGMQDALLEGWLWQREQWVESGLKVNFDATHVVQGVAIGGLTGPLFSTFSDEGDIGNTFSGDLRIELDTAKMGWWKDGTLNVRLHGRSGRSIVQRAGSIAAVNNEAVFPNVIDEFDGNALAITELTYSHSLTEKVTVYGGLMNTALGDENAIAGSSLSHAHFLNYTFLYSVVEDATVPHAALGGGLDFTPTEQITGSVSVFGSAETAGENPFQLWHGTTINTEWTLAHKWGERPGAQTLGLLYGINVRLTDIAANPRLVLISILTGLPIPTTESDTWACYYNTHQFLRGDENGGWGVFARWGISDGNPNVIKQNAAIGAGGVGLFPSRKQDRWGLGAFFLDMSDENLLSGLNIRDEVGGEVYYNIAVSPLFRVTLDAQVIDSGLPKTDTTWVFGMRTNLSF